MKVIEEIFSKSRLDEIERLKLHEPEIDEILNQYAEEAAKKLGVDVGLVSIVMDEAQVFAGSYGLQGWLKEVNGTPIEWSFCVNSIGTKSSFTVEDATTHEVVKDNPLVQVDGIRCYAGVPLITKNDEVIGNFCVLGTETHDFIPADIDTLKIYASSVMDHLEKRVA